MPELRRDPISGRWVIIATERARRPDQYPRAQKAHDRGVCPFCPGQEQRTTPAILALRPPDGHGPGAGAQWQVRVFPNKYPALMIEGDLERRADGLYDWMQGIGAHEVIVETPDHGKQLSELSEGEIQRVLEAWRERMTDLRNDRRFRYVFIFKNHGASAGASVEHSHSQLIALPNVPSVVLDEIRSAREYFDQKERCLFCDIVRQEIAQRVRVVHENPDFVVFEPYAPRFPFETWIMPRRHRTTFDSASSAELGTLADALRVALRKLGKALDDPSWNLSLHSAPMAERDAPHFHWHIEILPKLGEVGGLELGTGYYINPTPPEEAARFLRELSL